MQDWESLQRLSVTRGSGLLAPSFPPLLQPGGVPFPAPPRAIRRGNGRPQRATASPASAAHRLQHQLLPRLEKLVSVGYIRCSVLRRGSRSSARYGRATRWRQATEWKVRLGLSPPPHAPAAVLAHGLICVCCRGAAAAASAKLAKAAEPKPKWTDVARQIAVEFRRNPNKYGDGSGSMRSWVVGAGNLHPSGFPESSLTQFNPRVPSGGGPTPAPNGEGAQG